MSSHIKYLLLIISICVLSACTTNESEIVPNENELEEKLQKCILASKEQFENGGLFYKEIYEYDENGNKTKTTTNYTSGLSYTNIFENTYDENKRIINTKNFSKDGDLQSSTTFQYYPSGQIKVTQQEDYSDGTIVVTQIKEQNEAGKETYYLHENSTVKTEKFSSYNSNNDLLKKEEIKNGSLVQSELRTYNAKGSLLKSISKGVFVNKTVDYFYDENNDLVATKDNTDHETTYKYDKEKNTKESITTRYGEYVSSSKYELTASGLKLFKYSSINNEDYYLEEESTYHSNDKLKTTKIRRLKNESDNESYLWFEAEFKDDGNASQYSFYDLNTYELSYTVMFNYNCF